MGEINSSATFDAGCQHLSLSCEMAAGKTPTAHTSLAQISQFRCADCGVALYAIGQNGKPAGFITVLLTTDAPAAKAPTKPAKEPAEKKPPMADGPGKELMLIFSGLGVPGCQSCTDLADRMNEQGVEWCEANVDAIVADILPRAQEWLSRPEGGWTEKLKARAPQFAKEAVLKRYVGLALRNWRDKLELQQEQASDERS